MIKIYVKKLSDYPIEAAVVKKRLKKFLTEKGITSDCFISVAIVGKDTMYKIARKYLNEKNVLHNVLSFSESEVNKSFVYPPGQDILNLGEIVVCYPKAFEEAQKENKLIEQKVLELIEHGANHLLGIHH